MRWSGVADRLRPSSFRTQIVVTTMILMAVLVAGVGLVLQVLLEITAHREVSTVLTDHTTDVITSVSRTSTGTQVVVGAGSLDPGELVYDASGNLVAGSIERRAQSTAARLSTSQSVTDADAHGDLRLRATPFTTPQGASGVIVVSEETTPYEKSELYALLAAIALGVLAVGATGVIARRVTSQALQPVRLMAETASEWSESDLGRRFALGGPENEITSLGETLDHLLERVARAIRSEQRLTAELAHELRTPLTVIQGSADLALMRSDVDDDTRTDLEEIVASAKVMTETISTLLELARDLADASEGTCLLSEAVKRVAPMVPEPLVLVDQLPASGQRVAAPAALVTRALAPLVDNAARFARTRVTLELVVAPGTVDIVVTDDGPGIAPELADHVFEPGTSGSGGTGLGLAIARRVARTLGGDVLLDRGGVVLRLPTA